MEFTLRKAMLQSIVQQFATLMITFVTGMVIARLLTPAEVGVYSVSWALVVIAGPLRDLSISSYVISNETADDEILSAAYGVAIVTNLIFMVAMFLLSWPAAILYNSTEVGQVLRIIAISQIAPLAMPATILLTREMRFNSLRNVAIAAGLCQAVVAIALAFLGWGSLGLAWGYFSFTSSQ
jgi:O-antigen/teichoic acid export membrane protein